MTILKNGFFETLSDRVNREIKESLYENETFLNSRWSVFERSVVTWSSSYKKYATLIFLLASLMVINFIIWQPWVKPYVIQHIPYWRELLTWQGVFLSGQLTIIGVVYPLVIGLISILFQNKSAKKVIFPLYQKYSGFMFAGLSGLMLSGFIVVGYLLRPTIGESIFVAICLTTAVWFSTNVLLTAWFFVKTFRMLDDASRSEVIFRYSIHEACEIDVRRRVKLVLLENAVHHKLLSNPNERTLEVVTYKYSSDEYNGIARKIGRDKTIKDVRFWLINTAIHLQIWVLRLRKIQGGTLVIRPVRVSRVSNEMSVAQYSGFNINPLVKTLIKHAFSFEKDDSNFDVGLITVLSGFIGPAQDAVRDGNVREFSDAVDKLALWHAQLAESLSFKNDTEKLDNWLLLRSSGFGERTYLNELMSEYYRLAQETVERIPTSSRFYTSMLYFHRRIFINRSKLVEPEIKSLIHGSYYMWYLLVEWRSYNSDSEDSRVASKYEDILYDFVGAWESWLLYIGINSNMNSDTDNRLSAYITHLELTASTVISALRFNNFEAAGWGVDMLNNWLSNLSLEDNWNAEFSWRVALINHYFLRVESTNEPWRVILKGNSYDYDVAFGLAIKNAHLDLRVIAACYLLLKPGHDQSELMFNYVTALLQGSRIHPSSSVGQSRYQISNASDLLSAYIRHRDYPNYSEGPYGTWLASILESFGRIYEERRVPGRIYSGWGASDPQSMDKAYVEIAISLSTSVWNLSNNLEEVIFSSFFRHKDRTELISDLHRWIAIAKEETDYLLVDKAKLETLKTNFIQSVAGVIEVISESQNCSVSEAKLDRERLAELGIASSTILSNESTPKFPLSLFKTITRDKCLNEDSSFYVRILDYDKERVAEGIEANRAINEDSWLAKAIADSVKANILGALIARPFSTSYDYTNVDTIFTDIKKIAESMNAPNLFVGNQHLKNTLRKSLYEPEIAAKHGITRQDGFSNEYICHVGSCVVYSLNFSDVDYCLMTDKSIFHSLFFHKFAEDQYVYVDFEDDKENKCKGKLVLEYRMKVELSDDIQCIKLNLLLNDSSDGY